MFCPVCNGTSFGNYNGRPVASCLTCRSLERGRLQYLVLKEMGLPRKGSRILHVAPEPYFFKIFKACSGDLYHPCDLDVNNKNYKALDGRVFEIDLCKDIFRFPSNLFDMIIHNHVLEHVPHSVEDILKEHKRILAPGGHFIFSVPFRSEKTDEDLSENITSEEKIRRFGQSDHVRIFGTVDFPKLLEKIFGSNLVFDCSIWSDEFLTERGIPSNLARKFSGVSNFVYKSP